MATRKQTGQWGEALAARHLETHGYEIVARNWRHGHGELDLVVRRDGLLVFVEVRARHGQARGAPEETLGSAKREKIRQTAEAYLVAHDLLEAEVRFDVIAIDLDARNAVTRLSHYEAAL
ncbi:MAG: YraN family protein [Thermoflexales bacterium]|nr:YraN family protein [Thermoflexales bacterium]